MATLEALSDRFRANPHRHPGVEWSVVESILTAHPPLRRVLAAMEDTGGEPDVVDLPGLGISLVDCSPESPAGRRSLCYDEEALQARKENKPSGSALGVAAQIGIRLLDEAQYAFLQSLGEFDLKTSSWLATPDSVRNLGGAVFGDRRYGRVFFYHNGVQSYYASRGFRGAVPLQ